MSDDRDDLFGRLGALPSPTLEPRSDERIRRRARAAFVEAAAARRERPWLARLAALYARGLEPALAVGVTVAYLGWAVARIASLY